MTLAPPGELFTTLPPEVIIQNLAIQVQEQAITFYLKNIATFLIEQGNRITCDPAPNVPPRSLSLALSGKVMAALLYQRHCFIAHGSAVMMGRESTLFLGDSGAGKSSMAMALHQAGYPIITDDLIAIQEIDGLPYILPAFPQTRVTPETAAALELEWSTLIPLPTPDKRGFRFESQFIPTAIPVQNIYILKRGDGPIDLCPLDPHEQIMELMHHSEVMALFSTDRNRHFLDCAQLARALAIHYFERPMDWSTLPEVLDYLKRRVDPSRNAPGGR